jgi:hypothetical protein
VWLGAAAGRRGGAEAARSGAKDLSSAALFRKHCGQQQHLCSRVLQWAIGPACSGAERMSSTCMFGKLFAVLGKMLQTSVKQHLGLLAVAH